MTSCFCRTLQEEYKEELDTLLTTHARELEEERHKADSTTCEFGILDFCRTQVDHTNEIRSPVI